MESSTKRKQLIETFPVGRLCNKTKLHISQHDELSDRNNKNKNNNVKVCSHPSQHNTINIFTGDILFRFINN